MEYLFNLKRRDNTFQNLHIKRNFFSVFRMKKVILWKTRERIIKTKKMKLIKQMDVTRSIQNVYLFYINYRLIKI